MEFAKVLRKIRHEQGIMQTELAAALKVNCTTVSRWENGHNIPNSSVAAMIMNYARQSGVSTQCLIDLEAALYPKTVQDGVNDLSHIDLGMVDQLVNDSSNAVYVCDCENYDLLYLNATAARMINDTVENAAGKKCYEYLMHLDAPCSFCTMQRKPENGFVEEEFVYPETNRIYLMRGKLISWKGRRAHIEYVTESSARHPEQLSSQKLLEDLPCGVGACNVYPDGRIEMVNVNEGFYRLLHTTRAAWAKYIGFEALKAVHADDRPLLATELLRVAREGGKAEAVVRVRSDEERFKWLQVTLSRARREQSRSVMYLCMTNIDRQMRFELELKELFELAKLAANQNDISLWRFNPDSGRLSQILHAEARLGYPVEFPDGPEGLVSNGSIHGEDADAFRRMYRDVVDGRAFGECTARVLNRNTRSYEWRRIMLYRRKNDNQVTIMGVSVNADVRVEAQARYERELKRAQEDIASALSNYRINLTRGIVEAMRSRVFDFSGERFTGAAEYVIERALLDGIAEEDRPIVAHALNLQNLMDNYRRGRISETLRYRRELPGMGLCWIEGEISVARRVGTDDLILFYTTRSIDAAQKTDKAIVSVLEEETDLIVLLRPDSRRMRFIMRDRCFVERDTLVQYGTGAEFCRRYIPGILEEDASRVADFLDCDMLSERLSQADVLQLTFQLHDSRGQLRRKKARLFYLDRTRCDVLLIQRDITDLDREEKRRDEIMQNMLAKAEADKRAKNEFLVNMSRDMRTPLNAVLGLSSLTAEESENPARVRQNMARLREIGGYLARVVNDILDMSQLENSGIKLRLLPYTYPEFIMDMKAMFDPECAEKGVELCFETLLVNYTLLLDKQRFNQIFYNLFASAIRRTPRGGRVRFGVHYESVNGRRIGVEYSVCDTGSGFTPEFMQRLYEPFSADDDALAPELQGLGLTMSVTRQLAELMGGTLEVRSAPETGTCVIFRLECEMPTDAVRPGSAPAPEETQCYEALAGRRILLVEDHPLNAMIAARLLEKRGITVVHAENGRDALERFSASAPGDFDAILMDIRMPEMDGLATTRAIRALDREDARRVPVIAMSVFASPEDVASCREAGMNAHLAKPMDPENLYRTLTEQITSACGAARGY